MATVEEPHIITPEEEDAWIEKFTREVESAVASGRDHELDFFILTERIQLDLNALNKEGKLMYTLWVILLLAIKSRFRGEHKYPTMESFLKVYPRFEEESEPEKNNLWQSANWMAILFKMITARKNKGLVIQVIPKVVEGWGAKYVTGSGQTKATANRVHIFETEGNVKANQRGKMKNKAAEIAAAAAAKVGTDKNPKKGSAKAKEAPFVETNWGGSLGPGKKRKIPQDNAALDGSLKRTNFVFTAPRDKAEQIHTDVQFARDQLLRGLSGLTRDDSLGLGLDLVRSSSFLDADIKPGGTDRAYSWMEIPTTATNERGAVTAALATARDSSLVLDNMLIRLGENVSPAPLSLSATTSVPIGSLSDAPLSQDAISNMFAGYS